MNMCNQSPLEYPKCNGNLAQCGSMPLPRQRLHIIMDCIALHRGLVSAYMNANKISVPPMISMACKDLLLSIFNLSAREEMFGEMLVELRMVSICD